MQQDTSEKEPTRTATGAGVTLPGLLNILYRGRRTVLYLTLLGLLAGLGWSFLHKPLFRARAQIRPGIVSYAPGGGPVREWALKDIVRWFRTTMYWQDLREQDQFADFKKAPIILAEYIPSGPQFMQGGDVITLTNLSPDPLVSVAILDEAIKSFNRQASLDSLGSTMYLTLGGARVRMAKIDNDIEQITAEAERTRLAIDEQKRLLTVVAADDERLALRLERLAAQKQWRERTIAATETEVEATRPRLATAQHMLEVALAGEDTAGAVDDPAAEIPAGDPATQILLQSARREQAGRVGDLLLTVDRLSRAIYRGQVVVDSLRDHIAAIDKDVAELELQRRVDLAKRRGDIEQQIENLQLKLDRDLPHQRAQLRADREAEQVRADLLTPAERIGRITVSLKPVRPRKLRATAILTVLGFFSSLFVVLGWEYYRRNRAAITAAGPD